MSADPGSKLVALAIPTFGRRVYLQRCLESVGRLIHPEGVSLHLILLDNNPGGDAREIFDQICSRFDFPARYVHVKEQGIPFVRNRALEEALALDADFIGFLDDDEEAPPQWMIEAFKALRHYGGDIVSGPKARILPEGSPKWMRKSRCLGLKRAKREGHAKGHVSTSNVIFRSKIVGEMGLRFREEFNTTGGSDTIFFDEAKRMGAVVVWSRKAHIYEWIPPSRAKLSWMLQRDFRIGVNQVRRIRILDGEWPAWRVTGRWIVDVMFVRPIGLVVQEIRRGPRRAFRGLFVTRFVNYIGYVARMFGLIVALFGYRYHEYNTAAHGE